MVNGQWQQDIFIIYICLSFFIFFSIFRNVFYFGYISPLIFQRETILVPSLHLIFALFLLLTMILENYYFFEDSCCSSFIFKIPYNLLRNFFFKNLRTSSKIFKSCFYTYQTDFADHPSTLSKAFVIKCFMSVLPFVLSNFEYP